MNSYPLKTFLLDTERFTTPPGCSKTESFISFMRVEAIDTIEEIRVERHSAFQVRLTSTIEHLDVKVRMPTESNPDMVTPLSVDCVFNIIWN